MARQLLLALALAPSAAHASDAPKPKADDKGKAPAPKEEVKPVANQADSLEPSRGYVHHWMKMPGFSATGVPGGQSVTVGPEKGRTLVILFLASWCEPCQQIMQDWLRVEKRYKRLAADFVFVFSHDTKDDAEGFMKEYGITSGILANHDVLKAFHNPELPSIYVGDRHGWLTTRHLKATGADVAKVDAFLKEVTAY